MQCDLRSRFQHDMDPSENTVTAEPWHFQQFAARDASAIFNFIQTNKNTAGHAENNQVAQGQAPALLGHPKISIQQQGPEVVIPYDTEVEDNVFGLRTGLMAALEQLASLSTENDELRRQLHRSHIDLDRRQCGGILSSSTPERRHSEFEILNAENCVDAIMDCICAIHHKVTLYTRSNNFGVDKVGLKSDSNENKNVDSNRDLVGSREQELLLRNAALEDALNKNEDEVVLLEAQLNDQNLQMEEHARCATIRRAQICAAHSAIEELETELERVHAAGNMLRAILSDSEGREAAARHAAESIETDAAAQRQAFAADVMAREQEIASLGSELRGKARELEDARQAAAAREASLRQRADDLAAALQSAREEVTLERALAADRAERLKGSEEGRRAAEAEAGRLSRVLDENEAEVAALEAQLAAQAAAADELRRRGDSAEARAAAAEGRARREAEQRAAEEVSAHAAAEAAEAELERVHAAAQMLRGLLADAEGREAAARRAADEAREAAGKAKAKAAATAAATASATAAAAAAKAEAEAVKAELESCREGLRATAAREDAALRGAESVRAALEAARAELAQERALAAQRAATLADCEERRRAAEAETGRLSRVLDENEAEVAALEAQLAAQAAAADEKAKQAFRAAQAAAAAAAAGSERLFQEALLRSAGHEAAAAAAAAAAAVADLGRRPAEDSDQPQGRVRARSPGIAEVHAAAVAAEAELERVCAAAQMLRGLLADAEVREAASRKEAAEVGAVCERQAAELRLRRAGGPARQPGPGSTRTRGVQTEAWRGDSESGQRGGLPAVGVIKGFGAELKVAGSTETAREGTRIHGPRPPQDLGQAAPASESASGGGPGGGSGGGGGGRGPSASAASSAESDSDGAEGALMPASGGIGAADVSSCCCCGGGGCGVFGGGGGGNGRRFSWPSESDRICGLGGWLRAGGWPACSPPRATDGGETAEADGGGCEALARMMRAAAQRAAEDAGREAEALALGAEYLVELCRFVRAVFRVILGRCCCPGVAARFLEEAGSVALGPSPPHSDAQVA